LTDKKNCGTASASVGLKNMTVFGALVEALLGPLPKSCSQKLKQKRVICRLDTKLETPKVVHYHTCKGFEMEALRD
jgi:hypothetical protein